MTALLSALAFGMSAAAVRAYLAAARQRFLDKPEAGLEVHRKSEFKVGVR